MTKRALITGITGQDGSYLAEYLLGLGYEVHGLVRRVAIEDPTNRLYRIRHIADRLKLHAGSMESYASIFNIIDAIKPHELYHLAAQSFVSYSFDDEFSTMNANVNGTHYVLSAMYRLAPECRFYFAGSSEMFGKVVEIPQSETTRFYPRSVYGISKVVGYDLTRNYREAYGVYACTGILFNHESPRRGFEFVTRKITQGAAMIKLGLAKELRLGTLDVKRDWGFAGEYVEVMHQMLNLAAPQDFVVGTGETHSIREFLTLAFGELGLDWEKYVVYDEQLMRPAEVNLLVADVTKAQKELGWRPRVSFSELVTMMIRHDYDQLKGKANSGGHSRVA